ncbi:MAG TPA: two-component regulator propeller domain-containing protein [Rubricoccaceae bacterium]|nr:two-component regulator propeller domain-containing protein [Rubricoccaceae bacterium]
MRRALRCGALFLRVSALAGVAVLLAGRGAAQPFAVRFAHLTVNDGLSHNEVHTLLQDRRGFLWFGTADGLDRYDGYEVRSYRYDPADPAALSDNRITALLESRGGSLWVGTADGLNRFDAALDRFTTFRRTEGLADDGVAALFEDAHGYLWIGHADAVRKSAGGLSRLDPRTGRVERAFVGGEGELPIPIRAFAQGPDGVLWMGTGGGGLLKFDPRTGHTWAYRHREGDPASLAHDDVRALRFDGDGLLWVGTWGGGLDALDPATGRFTHYRHDPANPGTLLTDYVSALHLAEGGLWVGTRQPGERTGGALHYFDQKTFTRHPHVPADPQSVAPGGVLTLGEDRSRILWVGTEGGGVSRFDQASQPIPHFTSNPSDPTSLSSPFVTAFLEESKGVLWVGTARGLDRMDRFAGTFTHLPHADDAPGSLTHDEVTALARGPDGTLWIGSPEGLNRLAPGTSVVSHYRPRANDPCALAASEVRALHADTSGALWVGTAMGLNKLDAASGACVPFRHDPANAQTISDDRITVLYAAPETPHVLWVGTAGGGLNRFDTRTGRARRYATSPQDPNTLSHRHVVAVRTRPGEPEVVWVGTAAGGLNRLDARTGRVQRYPRTLLPAAVDAIEVDDEGRLWLATRQGLLRFDPDSTTARIYDVDRGVQSRQFTPGASGRTGQGELLFGGIAGFNLFTPADFSDNPHPPQVVLTGLTLGGRPVVPGDGGPLDRAPADTRRLDLAYDQNDVGFTFVGLHFARPPRNRYRVRLEGVEEEWRDVGTQRAVSYANLKPGRYRFLVHAANSDGVWSAQPARLALVIRPPFWATWWFRVLAVGAVLAAVGLAYRERIRRIAARNRELEEQVRERTEALRRQSEELRRQNERLETTNRRLQETQGQLVQAEKLASLGRLTAGVAHEIKNPLNFVNNFAELSAELTQELRRELTTNGTRAPDDVRAAVEPLLDDLTLNTAKIAEHGRRADAIVRAMLMHARGTTGERAPTDLTKLLDDTIDLAVQGAGRGGDGVPVIVEREDDPSIPLVEMVPQAFSRLVLNLLDNAIYAVRERAAREGPGYQPTVWVRTEAVGGGFRLEVEDNGVGMPNEVCARLFEPFFTTKPTGAGTGLGLSLAHDIVHSHGGTISCHSNPGEGTVFTVTIPTGTIRHEGSD